MKLITQIQKRRLPREGGRERGREGGEAGRQAGETQKFQLLRLDLRNFREYWNIQILPKNGQHSVPQSPLQRGTGGRRGFRAAPFLGQLPGASRTGASFIGGWRLLITRQLSPVSVGHHLRSLDPPPPSPELARKRGHGSEPAARRAHVTFGAEWNRARHNRAEQSRQEQGGKARQRQGKGSGGGGAGHGGAGGAGRGKQNKTGQGSAGRASRKPFEDCPTSPAPAKPQPSPGPPNSKHGSKKKTRSKLSVKTFGQTFGQNFRSKRFGQNVFGTQTLNNFYKP